jgi:hypothetical protein
MKNTDPTLKPLFRAEYRQSGSRRFELGPIRTTEAHAATDCHESIAKGAVFAAILRDSQGTDHPDNAGKFFLHRYVKA